MSVSEIQLLVITFLALLRNLVFFLNDYSMSNWNTHQIRPDNQAERLCQITLGKQCN